MEFKTQTFAVYVEGLVLFDPGNGRGPKAFRLEVRRGPVRLLQCTGCGVLYDQDEGAFKALANPRSRCRRCSYCRGCEAALERRRREAGRRRAEERRRRREERIVALGRQRVDEFVGALG